VFNATGPEKRLGMGELLAACQRATTAKGTLTWVSADFLEQQKVELPIWAAYQGKTKGSHTRSNQRALKAGLRFRPHDATVKDTLAWYKTQGSGGRVKLAGPTAEQETALLAAWRKAGAPTSGPAR
jgi:2'-hydroxyisoflavone reductase